MFDLISLRGEPYSLGKFELTKEMMECMVDDRLKIHFEYGKRNTFAGSVACFDHTPYIKRFSSY